MIFTNCDLHICDMEERYIYETSTAINVNRFSLVIKCQNGCTDKVLCCPSSILIFADIYFYIKLQNNFFNFKINIFCSQFIHANFALFTKATWVYLITTEYHAFLVC